MFLRERSGKLADFPPKVFLKCQRAETVLLGRYYLDAFDCFGWFFFGASLGHCKFSHFNEKIPAHSVN